MKKTLILSCALALASMSSAAFAAEGGAGFIRADLGRTKIEGDQSYTSFGFGGGYWFNKFVGVEGNLTVLGAVDNGDGTTDNLHEIGVGVVAKKNFGTDGNGFFVGGRLGYARLTGETLDENFNSSNGTSWNKPYYGVNVGYDFNDHWGVRLDWNRRSPESVNVDNLAIGGEYRF